MSTFFDLREFLITLLKKFRLSLLIIIVFTLAGGLIRFIPLMHEYLSYDKQVEAAKSMDTASDYPYFYEARRTIYIEPNYITEGNNVIDTSKNVAQAYQECYQNKEILQPLVDEYFEEASKLYYENIEQQIKYNYINSAAASDFRLQDFYRWITISISNNFVDLKVKTPNAIFSEKMVATYEELLSGYVRELIGEYYYQITDGQIGISEPTAVNGLIPISESNLSSGTSTKPTISFIIARSIKGAIWGLGAGIGASIILSFFFQCLNLNLLYESELKAYPLNLLVTLRPKTPKKKRLFSFIDRWIDLLEGNGRCCTSYQEASALAASYIKEISVNPETVLITGAGSIDSIEAFAIEMQKVMPNSKIIYSACITTNPETIENAGKSSVVLLYEEIGKSNKSEIFKEIEHIQYLNKEIIGIVLEK